MLGSEATSSKAGVLAFVWEMMGSEATLSRTNYKNTVNNSNETEKRL